MTMLDNYYLRPFTKERKTSTTATSDNISTADSISIDCVSISSARSRTVASSSKHTTLRVPSFETPYSLETLRSMEEMESSSRSTFYLSSISNVEDEPYYPILEPDEHLRSIPVSTSKRKHKTNSRLSEKLTDI